MSDIKLKEIAYGTVVNCSNKDEVIELWNYLHKNHGMQEDDKYSLGLAIRCCQVGYNFKIKGNRLEETMEDGVPYRCLIIPETKMDRTLDRLREIMHEAAELLDECKEEPGKKKSEVEWFWQGTIYRKEDGYLQQVENQMYDTGCECREKAEEYMENILKEYCRNHEGTHATLVDHVGRIKE